MNVKQTVKRMSAVATGALMLGATVVGAMAYDLSDYPMPFVDGDGVFTGNIVIGEKAQPADVIGAVDIAASLQAEAKSPVDVSSGGVVSVSGGKVEDTYIGATLEDSFGATLDYTDLPFLEDSSVDIDIGDVSGTYDFHEEIKFDEDSSWGVNLTTGLAWDGSDDYEDNFFMTVGSSAIGYYFVFDETLEAGNYLNDSSTNDPIEFYFLGRKLRVTSATATSITVDIANEYYLNVGDTATVEGKTIELLDVSSNGNAVVVKVDGQTGTVTNSGRVNGIKISIRDAFSSDTKDDRSANLLIGDKTTDTFSDGEEYIGEDSDNPEWVWDLASLDTGAPTIGIVFAANLDKEDSEDYANYDSVIYEGQSVMFPHDFAEVSFDSLTQSSYSQYDIDTDTKDLYWANGTLYASSVKAIRVKSDQSNAGLLVGSTKTDTLYIALNNTNASAGQYLVFYKDTSDSKAKLGATVNTGGTLFTVDFGKTSQAAVLTSATTLYANITFTLAAVTNGPAQETLTFGFVRTPSAIDYLGNTDTDADTGLWYGTTSIAGHEADLALLHGVKVDDPDSNFQKTSGDLTVHFPADVDDFRANMVISGQGTTRNEVVDTGAYQVNPIAVGLAVFDTEAGPLLSAGDNLIVIGGPAVNTVAMELMGNPTDAQVREMFNSNKAKIKLYEDKNAILVAGWSAQDTLGAAYVLADYGMYDLTGDEVEVLVPSLNDISVVAPTLPSAIEDINLLPVDPVELTD